MKVAAQLSSYFTELFVATRNITKTKMNTLTHTSLFHKSLIHTYIHKDRLLSRYHLRFPAFSLSLYVHILPSCQNFSVKRNSCVPTFWVSRYIFGGDFVLMVCAVHNLRNTLVLLLLNMYITLYLSLYVHAWWLNSEIIRLRWKRFWALLCYIANETKYMHLIILHVP